MSPGIVLRDVHVPPAPPLWPLAPGWWLLALVGAVLVGWWLLRGRVGSGARARALRRFDAELEHVQSAPERLAAASELLRRAARRVRDDADRLHGEAWLEFLDAGDGAFLRGDGRLLLEGPFRADVDGERAAAALAAARARFASLMVRR